MKKELRKIIRQEKQRHSSAELSRYSAEIQRLLSAHPKVLGADTVLLYWSMGDEVDTHELVRLLASHGKTVLLPRVVSATEMTWHPFSLQDVMSQSDMGIYEPNTPSVPVESMGQGRGMTAIVPGMAFSLNRERMGRGRGYYDRLLARLPLIYKIGVCFPFQLRQNIPTDDYDVRMDEVLTL
jgi:5-formyltetrahydrofolate cyclo-ligase